jgi:hypothetical protein
LYVLQNEKENELEGKTAQSLIKKYIDSNAMLQTDTSFIFLDLIYCINVRFKEISTTDNSEFKLK